MKPRLDPREAPKGYRACLGLADASICARCALHVVATGACKLPSRQTKIKCVSYLRKDCCEVYFVRAPKRPSPAATFARWWIRPSTQLMTTYGIRPGYVFEISLHGMKLLARRAFNAGRRAAKKRRT